MVDPMADGAPIEVHGPNRLIADIINGVIGDVGEAGRQVTVLVDPEPEHWSVVRDRAVVTVLSDPAEADVLRAIRRGADAVIDAQSVINELPRAVAIVRAGGVVLAPTHARLVVDALRREAREPQISLTRRESDIIQSIILGDSVKQTALRLGIAQKTVENLQRRMFRKLDVRNRAQAVARVHELALLEIDLTQTEGMSPATCGGVNP